jgi:transcriptional regulator with XRE-family HTH domain
MESTRLAAKSHIRTDMITGMDVGATLRRARERAGLTQGVLAARAGTSQATISAYERGVKQPSVATFSRLLASAGARLAVEPLGRSVVAEPSAAELAAAGATLAEVITLAEALPVRHSRELGYPRLGGSRAA